MWRGEEARRPGPAVWQVWGTEEEEEAGVEANLQSSGIVREGLLGGKGGDSTDLAVKRMALFLREEIQKQKNYIMLIRLK